MLNKDKLHRIRGILSAKQGTQVPKFQNAAANTGNTFNNGTTGNDGTKKKLLFKGIENGKMIFDQLLMDGTSFGQIQIPGNDPQKWFDNNTEYSREDWALEFPEKKDVQTTQTVESSNKKSGVTSGVAGFESGTDYNLPKEQEAIARASQRVDEQRMQQAITGSVTTNTTSANGSPSQGVSNGTITEVNPNKQTWTKHDGFEEDQWGTRKYSDGTLIYKNGYIQRNGSWFDGSSGKEVAIDTPKGYNAESGQLVLETPEEISKKGLSKEKIQTVGAKVNKFLDIADSFVDKSKFAADDATVHGTGRQAYDAIASAATMFGPVGTIAGGAMKLVAAANDIFGSKANDFAIDHDTLETVGGSYGGSTSTIQDAASKANKKYGLFNWSGRNKANKLIDRANREQYAMSGIAKDARDLQSIRTLEEPYNLNYEFNMSGGYDQRYLRAAKLGGTLELSKFNINQYKEVNSNYILDFYKKGGAIQSNSWNPTIEGTEFYWDPDITFDINVMKSGGTIKEPEIEVIEVDTTQKSVIPEGALHKNKHHLDQAGVDDSELTKKGIPVVDKQGDQQAEIELNEIIFTLEVTKELENRYKEYYEEDTKQSRKDELALEAGKLLWKEILYNTDDRTGLIDSLKKGGAIPAKPVEVPDATYVKPPVQQQFKQIIIPEFETFEELKAYLKKTGRDSEEDYDLRAAYNDPQVYQVWREEEQKHPGNGHWLDKYKKPNHPTFSEESIYSNDETPGGSWIETTDGKVYFIPSDYLKKLYSKEFYDNYFRNEPEVTVIYNTKKSSTKKKHKSGGVLQQEDINKMVKQALVDIFSKLV